MSLRDELVKSAPRFGQNDEARRRFAEELVDAVLPWLESKLREREAETVERCAAFLEGVRQLRTGLAKALGPCFDGEDAEGWRDLTLTEKGCLRSVAKEVRSLFPDPNYAERIRLEARLEERKYDAWQGSTESDGDFYNRRIADLEAQLDALKPEAGKDPHA